MCPWGWVLASPQGQTEITPAPSFSDRQGEIGPVSLCQAVQLGESEDQRDGALTPLLAGLHWLTGTGQGFVSA